ncbi:MAG: pyrroline-5-carboxylate reductase [Desulfonatronovibrionaceae bacterium]
MADRIGFIGTGNMGGAMISGLASIPGLTMCGFDPDRERLEAMHREHGLQPLDSPLEVVRESDYAFYAVKPSLMESLIKETLPGLDSSTCLVSIAAGIRLARLISWSENRCPVARIMPNTPALVDRGVFALCLEHTLLSRKHREFLKKTMEHLGLAHVLPEKSFDLFTALIGSGPAYVFYFMESMVEAGVLLGMDRNQASGMVKELFAGAAHMSIELDIHLAMLREMVSSPGGTTVQGLKVLEEKAVKAAIMQAVEKAAEKSRLLGE